MNAVRIFHMICVVFFIVVLGIAMVRGTVDPVYGIAVIGVGIASVLYSLVTLSDGDATRNDGHAGMEQGKNETGDAAGASFGGNDVGDCGQQIAEGVVLQKLFEAAENGDAVAQCTLGTCFQYGNNGVKKDMDEAVKWYRKAVAQGNAGAQFLLGVCYHTGNGVTKDVSEAAKLFRISAAQGLASAQCSLGTCYFNGGGVEKDEVEAMKWFRKAAEQGEANAQFLLGTCYYNGTGTEKNYAEAVKLFKKAVEQGNANAQFLLGACYFKGEGVEKDYAEAVKWIGKAAEQGHEGAREVFRTLSQAAG